MSRSESFDSITVALVNLAGLALFDLRLGIVKGFKTPGGLG
jgi:hypothetical protein